MQQFQNGLSSTNIEARFSYRLCRMGSLLFSFVLISRLKVVGRSVLIDTAHYLEATCLVAQIGWIRCSSVIVCRSKEILGAELDHKQLLLAASACATYMVSREPLRSVWIIPLC